MKLKMPEKKQSLWGFLLLSALSLITQWYLFDFLLITKLLMPWLLYTSLLFIFRPFYAAIFVWLIECLFLRIHFLKMAFTNSPLEASDIFGWKQALFVRGYTDFLIPLLALALIVCAIKGLTFKKRQLLFLPAMLLVTTSCMQERHPTDYRVNPVSLLMRIAHVTYVDWNFATNIKENGVLNHLFMTLPMGQIPLKGRVPFPVEEKRILSSKRGEKPDIFLVLCESCYTSSTDKFVTPMADLAKEGFRKTTMISPVYGGMTAEAEFEVLTGLPSQRYKGIDFQYFADSFSEEAKAFPRILLENGYSTFSAHNNKGYFWRRNTIHPKFGFQKSYFLESMNWTGDEVPEDEVLFVKALNEYKNNLNTNKKTFAFLITLYTHGPYKEKNSDGGESEYRDKLDKSIKQFVAFQKTIMTLASKKSRPVLFLIFGDHKPAMTVSFWACPSFS